SLLIPSGFNFLIAKPADNSYAFAAASKVLPQRVANNSFGLQTTAKSILVIDNATGTVLYSKSPDLILPIASITKLMNALVVLDAKPDWNKKVMITKDDQREGGLVNLLPGEEVTVKDLFYLMLVSSTNEAAVALAKSIGLPDFAAAMNHKAKELGMADTYFIDPSGVEPGNVSSPADLAKLAQAAFARPEIAQAVTSEEHPFLVLNNQRQSRAVNTDRLLGSFLNQGEYQILGAKTGYLNEAGYCLLLQLKKNNGPDLTLVILGAASITDRWQEAKGLVDWVFRNYVWP
ncbi:MAG: serine hydrolase, partial [Patescibacteria group bacterium]